MLQIAGNGLVKAKTDGVILLPLI